MIVKADLVNEFGESMYDSCKWYVRRLLTKGSKLKEDEEDETTEPISPENFRRVGHVHRQLAHVMVTCCFKVGSKATREYVLPILGQYFDCWSDSFGIAVEGSTEAALALSLFEGITRPLDDLLGSGIVRSSFIVVCVRLILLLLLWNTLLPFSLKNTTFSSIHSSTGTTTQQHDESVVATIGS